jgi:hypothetical protein
MSHSSSSDEEDGFAGDLFGVKIYLHVMKLV